jgi:hypothetical protein
VTLLLLLLWWLLLWISFIVGRVVYLFGQHYWGSSGGWHKRFGGMLCLVVIIVAAIVVVAIHDLVGWMLIILVLLLVVLSAGLFFLVGSFLAHHRIKGPSGNLTTSSMQNGSDSRFHHLSPLLPQSVHPQLHFARCCLIIIVCRGLFHCLIQDRLCHGRWHWHVLQQFLVSTSTRCCYCSMTVHSTSRDTPIFLGQGRHARLVSLYCICSI